ncbi:MAG: VWA domain-containing protein [Candidatus Obscuribacterales bacterium]|nr:VWA domain-containing protein [Candidatus Obscuribacterales bacterium]
MFNVFFSQPWWLLGLPALVLLYRTFRSRQYLPMSSATLLSHSSSSTGWLAKSPKRCFFAMMVLLVIAAAGPQRYQSEATETVMGRDIVLAVDISGSMSAKLPNKPNQERPKGYYDLPVQPHQASAGEQPYRRIDAAQDALMQFVNARHDMHAGDCVGLFLFDDSPRLAWPLTNDLRQIGRKGNWLPYGFMNERIMGSGTNFGDKGYGPIEAGVDHMQEYGQSPARVLILVTDGDEKMSDSLRGRLRSMLAKHNVRFYVIGVGETLARENVDIIAFAREVEGQVFRVENAGELEKCFDTINQLEQGPIKVSSFNVFQELYPYVLFMAMFCCVGWVLASAIVVVI